MKDLFRSDSLKTLRSLAFQNTLYGFDFDGTLLKIDDYRKKVSLDIQTIKLLQELSTLSPVSVLSGRSLPDLKGRLGFKPKYLIGNHGLEAAWSQTRLLQEASRICRSWVHTLKSALKNKVLQGVELEDKKYTVSIHYRASTNKLRAKRTLLRIVPQLSPIPRILPGKCVINLLPVWAPNKGTAFSELMGQLKVESAFYIGDDETDEDIFSSPNSRILTVRVGTDRSSKAKYFIPRQSDIRKLLKILIHFQRTHEGH